MSIRKLFLLQDVQLAVDETLARAAHTREVLHGTLSDYARRSGLARRQRLKLLAENLASHLLASAEEAERKGRRAAREAAVQIALLASHQLVTLANKIEQKAQAIKQAG